MSPDPGWLAAFALVLALGLVASVARAAFRSELRAALLEVLAAAVRRGLPLGPALAAAVAEGAGEGYAVLRRVQLRLALGDGLSTALERAAPDVFPRPVTEAIRVGEESGDLAGALLVASRLHDTMHRVVERSGLAIAHPFALTLLLAFMHGVVHPRIDFLAQDLGAGAPVDPGLAGPFARAGLLLMALAAAFILMHQMPARWGLGRLAESLTARLPVAGRIARLRAGARIARSLAALVQAGRPLGEALRRAAPAAANAAIEAEALDAAAAIDAGAPPDLALALLRPAPAFGARIAAASGDGPARLAGALDAIAAEYTAAAQARLEGLVSIAHPLIALATGAIVALEMAYFFGTLAAAQQRIKPW